MPTDNDNNRIWESQQKLKQLQEEANLNMDKSLSKQLQQYGNLLEAGRKVAGTVKLGTQDWTDQADVIDGIVEGNKDLSTLLEEQNKYRAKGRKDLAGIYDIEIKKQRVQKLSETAMGAADTLTGGMASKAKEAKEMFDEMGGKIGLASAGLAAAMAILISFSGKMDVIGQQFGAVGLHSSAIRGDLLQAEVSATKLGKSLEDVMTAVTTMSSEFGTSFSESRGMAASVIDTSVALGLSVSEGAQLVGIFTQISGLTAESATALAKQVTLLATASDVAPQMVLRDIAGSTEQVAGFTDETGENIARGAIQARKLGISLSDVASTAEKMLEFQSAVQGSMEASILLGRNINVQKLQELSLAGDLEGVAKEQRRLLGGQSDFLAMNIIQRKALAESLGLSVDQAAKMLAHEEEAVSLAGQLAGQPGFDSLVGEKGISTLTSLTGSLKSLGASLTNSLGPILNVVIKLLLGVGKVLEFILEPFNMLFRGMNMGIDNSFSAPSVAMAKGGIVTRPTNALIGEAGPEAVIPLSGGGGVAGAMGGDISALKSEMVAVRKAIQSLALKTTISNKDLNIILTPSKA